VYAGSNDGMLHAFDGDIDTSQGHTGGRELFAYIPSFMYGTASSARSTGLAALGNPNHVHTFRVNGPLRAADVNFNQTSDTQAATGDWHTVLVGGLGKGGKGYVALDITDPDDWSNAGTAKADENVAKKVLWEFPAAPELAAGKSNLVSSAQAAATMGYSYGEPQIVKTTRFGWVALLTSGYNNADGKGYLYIVDIQTGALLATVVTPEGSVDAPINLARITGYIPDPRSFLVEAVYGADMRGNVWRFDLRGTGEYPKPVKLAELSNAQGTRQSVTAPIRVVIDPGTSNKRYLVIGTGRMLADSDATSTDTESIYALIDGDAKNFFTDQKPGATLPGNLIYPVKRDALQAVTDLEQGAKDVTVGWYLDLKLPTDPVGDIAYRVTLMPVAVNGYMLVAANQPSGDPCAPSGKGRLYILALGNGKKWALEQRDSIYVSISNKSFDGQGKQEGTTANGEVTIKDLPPGKAIRTGRLSWREAPSDE